MLYRDQPQVIVHSLDPLENMTAYLQGVIARQQAKSQEAIPPIKIDVLEDSRAYIVKADLPGVQKENIRVAIEGNQVSINTDLSAQPSKESVESKASGLALLHRASDTTARSPEPLLWPTRSTRTNRKPSTKTES
jgi:hypothetical protein